MPKLSISTAFSNTFSISCAITPYDFSFVCFHWNDTPFICFIFDILFVNFFIFFFKLKSEEVLISFDTNVSDTFILPTTSSLLPELLIEFEPITRLFDVVVG